MKEAGTSFQQMVWKALEKIPSGKVTTYKAIAEHIGSKAMRAVGSAVGKNPYAPDVPCHRVIPSSGKIGNYSAPGGVDKKIELLAKEGVEVRDGWIVKFKEKLYLF